MYEKIVPLVQNYEQKLMETLNQDEQAVLDLILNKLTRFVSD